MNKKIKRKKLKSNEFKFQKHLLSKTVSPSHNKSKRQNLKKKPVPGKNYENLSPIYNPPVPNFPKTVTDKIVAQQKQIFLGKRLKQPKKTSVKNFTKTKSKLKKYNRKKVSHNERTSTKVNQMEQYDKNSQIRILIKNEIINNNNNHFYNLQVQKPFAQPKLTFMDPGNFIYDSHLRNNLDKQTPIYDDRIHKKQFIYEDFGYSQSTELKAKDVIKQKLKKGKTTDGRPPFNCSFDAQHFEEVSQISKLHGKVPEEFKQREVRHQGQTVAEGKVFEFEVS